MNNSRVWLGAELHDTWLRSEELRLLDFGRNVVREDGLAAWLDDSGRPDSSHPSETYITARMAHVYYLGGLRGVPGCDPIARRLMRGLRDVARDSRSGGWNETEPSTAADKAAYTHAFVVLAASTGALAGDGVATEVLSDALAIVDERFWDAHFARFRDAWSQGWTVPRTYRGLNANMHMVEAMLAATDATGDQQWAQRAVGICEFVLERASANGWRIPEHFDDNWVADLDFNADQPADRFKPFGATVGHSFEWSRLIVQSAPISTDAPRFLAGAQALFANAAADGWARDGHPGFVYTTDWNGNAVVRDRLHWVVAEAIGAAAVLAATTGDEVYAARYAEWWDYVATYLIDREHGSWRHQLDAENRPASTVWDGKPDIYHAYQAVLISQLPPSTSVAAAVRAQSAGGIPRA
ncbi:MAG TPA: AGE family epimerase/isomerase [Galbitalea sp.]